MKISKLKYSDIFKTMLLLIFALSMTMGIIFFSFALADMIKNKNEINDLSKEKLRLEIKIKKYQIEQIP